MSCRSSVSSGRSDLDEADIVRAGLETELAEPGGRRAAWGEPDKGLVQGFRRQPVEHVG